MQDKYQLRAPKDETELASYFELRYRVLFEPWDQSFESSQDKIEDTAFHRVIVDENDKVVAVGRVHLNNDKEAQIKGMAVDENYRKLGLGERIMIELEEIAIGQGAEEVMLNAMIPASGFYEKCGYYFARMTPFKVYNDTIDLKEYRKKLRKKC